MRPDLCSILAGNTSLKGSCANKIFSYHEYGFSPLFVPALWVCCSSQADFCCCKCKVSKSLYVNTFAIGELLSDVRAEGPPNSP